jgi:hypothetical protein
MARRSCASVQNYFRTVDFYPRLRQNQALLESLTAEAARRSASFRTTFPTKIPVVVHVLINQAADDISDAQIESQIEVLNEDFGGKNDDLENVPGPFKESIGSTGLEFYLAEVDPAGAARKGILRINTSVPSFGVDDGMKAAATGGNDPWDTERYLNLWVCRLGGGLLGYAQFPGGDPATDGVVVTTSAFGRRGSAEDPFNLGRTATHEVGHYLNLSHVWGESRWPTCTDSDFVNDTPNQYGPNTGKPTFPAASCGNTPHGDMFVNFMDYVDDDTMVMFTKEQVLRMHAALEFMRPKLGTLADGSPMLVA